MKKGKIRKEKISLHFGLRGIKVKLIGAYLIPVALIVLLGILSYSRASNAIIANYKASTRNTIQKTAEYYNLLLQNIDTKAQKLSGDSEIRSYYNSEYKESPKEETSHYSNLNKNLLSEKTSDSNINLICVFAPYGKGLTSNGMIGQDAYADFTKTEEAKKILAASNMQTVWTGKHAFLDDYLKLAKGSYGISLIRQIVNNKMETIGVLYLDITAASLQKPLTTIDLPKGSECAFITPDGREITAQGENTKAVFYGQDYYQAAVKSKEATGLQYTEGNKYFFLYVKVGDNGCMLCTQIPKSAVIKQAEAIKTVTILVVLFAILVAILVGVILANGIGNAIRNINIVVKKAEEGDLTVIAKTKRKDEFMLLAKHVTGMLSGMKALVNKTVNVSGTILESAETVAAASVQLVESARSITEVVEHIEAGIEQQAEDAQSCLKKMGDLDEKITYVNESTGQMHQFADNTKNIVKAGIITMNELESKAKDTSKITRVITENIVQLGEESSYIGGIIATINEIADQTNLLALNASIEAARAGEAGKGFAVVAVEIRKLADASLKASQKISDMIGSIAERTKVTVTTAGEAEETVKLQETALRNTAQVFHDIINHVEGLIKNINDITTRVKDIEETKAITLNAITDISAVLEETASASVEVQSAAESQLAATEHLNKAAGSLREEARELQNSISSFKLD
jgi:Methyl-accepting chemotaxis protein